MTNTEQNNVIEIAKEHTADDDIVAVDDAGDAGGEDHEDGPAEEACMGASADAMRKRWAGRQST
jgi:hypothetical protein